jgi:hypothetical protein
MHRLCKKIMYLGLDMFLELKKSIKSMAYVFKVKLESVLSLQGPFCVRKFAYVELLM